MYKSLYSYNITNNKFEVMTNDLNDISKLYEKVYPQYTYESELVNSICFWPQRLNNSTGIKLVGADTQVLTIIPSDELSTDGALRKSKIFNKEAIYYSSSDNSLTLVAYPSYNGVVFEYILESSPKNNQIKFLLKSNVSLSVKEKDDQYISYFTTYGNDSLRYVAQMLGIFDRGLNIYEETALNYNVIDENSIEVILNFNSDFINKANYPITVVQSFENYTNKNILDSQTYKNAPTRNSYLKSYSILGENNEKLFMRFLVSSENSFDNKSIDSVIVKIKKLAGEDLFIEAYAIDANWCSFTICENNMPVVSELLWKGLPDDTGYYNIDITEWFKSNYKIKNSVITDYGIMIKLSNKQDSKIAIATSDNPIYPVEMFFDINMEE